jgi:hypothetical protein
VILGVLDTVAALVEAEPNADPAAQESLAAARQVRDQDVVSDRRRRPTLRNGVARLTARPRGQ